MKHTSLLYHDRPRLPGEELVYWVEHVVRTNGAVHLRSPALLVPWFQKMYLDLLGFIILGAISVGIVVKILLFGVSDQRRKNKFD